MKTADDADGADQDRLRKRATGWIGSSTEFWKALSIRVIREIRGFNFGVLD